jgi:ribosomal protein L13
VIVQKNGKDVVSYKTVDDLVESHIKGMLSVQEEEGRAVIDLLKKYRSPSDISKF